MVFIKDGNSPEEVNTGINKGRNLTRYLNLILRDNIDVRDSSVVSSKNREILQATEMDYMKGSCRWTRVDRIHNEEIRKEMELDKDILDEVQKKAINLVRSRKQNDRRKMAKKKY